MPLSIQPQHILYVILTILSHIGASLFFAKPRFGKIPTALIWLVYAAVFVLLPPGGSNNWSFFITLGLHLVLFFITTVGRWEEKGFLFLSYATIHTCFSRLFNIVEYQTEIVWVKVVVLLFLVGVMQLLLYRLLLPAFRTVTPYIRRGWGMFYAVVISFFALIVGQSVFPARAPMNTKEIVIFLLTILAFCITYITVFSSMKNIVELSREKQKQIHTELLQSQVDAQAKEAAAVRQNRHDMRHHYQMLLSFARNGDLEKITDYLERQTERIETMTTGRLCENETVNNILKVYQQKAAAQNISMEIRAAAKPTISIPAPELVTVIANVLENALHGARDSGCDGAFIRISIKHKAQRLVVRCENSCTTALNFAEMPEHLRGIGIQSIESTADQFGGSCHFSASDGVFSAMVIMNE